MTKTKTIIIFLSIFLIIWGFAKDSLAATINAASCSYADVLAAYNATNPGGVVSIPTCPEGVIWTSTLNITKPITLQGTGSFNESTGVYTTGTKIIRNGLMVYIDNSSGGINSDKVRVTGIHFDRTQNQTGSSYALTVNGGTYSEGEYITNLRIDNCRFDWGFNTLNVLGVVFGVIDYNYFYNTNHGVRVFGAGNAPWQNYSYAPGTANMLFFEDNFFYYNATTTGTRSWDGIFYDINGGARIVVRHNDFDATDCTTCYSLGVLHIYGFWGNDWRMTMLVEAYENTATFGSNLQNAFGWRGGSMLLFNNTVSAKSGGQFAAVGTVCNDSVGSTRISSTAVYPMQDQVNNSFLWGNTWNGSAIDSGDITNYGCLNRVGIQGDGKDHTEVWLHAPESSGGKNVYPGSLGAGNWKDGDGVPPLMYFTSSGANAYYPYTSYTYPHPLRAGTVPDTTPPAAPTGVTII